MIKENKTKVSMFEFFKRWDGECVQFRTTFLFVYFTLLQI